jgi:hypothetical protein
MVLDTTRLDLPFVRGGPLECYPVLGFIVDGQLDPIKLKTGLDIVFDHNPILAARMSPNGCDLFLVDDRAHDKFGWKVEDNRPKRLETLFTVPRVRSDCISFLPSDPRDRAEFYIPESTMTSGDNLIHFRIQIFSDKTVIGLMYNHFLTDAAGIHTILKLWSKALRGEVLQKTPISRDPFLPHYIPDPAPPPGLVPLSTWKGLHLKYLSFIERISYGPPQPRSIFIPRIVLDEWKAAVPDVSINDLITAWVLKAWASSRASSRTSGLISIYIIADLKRRLPDIVPQSYLRNAITGRLSPYPFRIDKLNAMSFSEVAREIHSFNRSITPEFELNCQSYEHSRRRDGIIMVPETPALAISSVSSMFYSPDINFGGKTEVFDCLMRSKNPRGERGTAWLDKEGASVTFWMSEGRWKKGVWKNIARI